MNDRLLSLLGMARRASRLSLGHDAAETAIVKNRAKLCLVCSDGSQRLKREFSHACSYGGKSIGYIELGYTMEELSKAVGSKTAVLTVDDEGFARAAEALLTDKR